MDIQIEFAPSHPHPSGAIPAKKTHIPLDNPFLLC